MDTNGILSEMTNGVITLAVTLITLIFGWHVGNRLTYEMNINQKRREIELNQLNQFFQLYGEFFSTWKLYDYLLDNHLLNVERHIQILKRASNAEGGIEAIIMKITADKKLSQEDIDNLGCFRQSYQFLRESIRDKKRINWDAGDHPGYMFFKELSCKVAALIMLENERPTYEEIKYAFIRIRDNKYEKIWNLHNKKEIPRSTGEKR